MNDLIAELTKLAYWAEQSITQAALVFLRIGGMIALLPALGEQVVPHRVKLAASLAMTVIIVPTLAMGSHSLNVGHILLEAVVGLLLGMGLRFLILALQTAGTLAAQSVSLAQMLNGTGMEPQPVLANLLTLAGTALFLALGGLGRAVELVRLSYDLFPVGTVPEVDVLAAWAVDRGAESLGVAFSLAAPFVLAALLYNLALGVINRAMPALMVVFIGAPALTLGGMVMLALLAGSMLKVWKPWVLEALKNPFGG